MFIHSNKDIIYTVILKCLLIRYLKILITSCVDLFRLSRYGDKTARTLPGRIFAVVWVLMGLVIGSLLIGSIATAFTSTSSPPKDSVKMLYGANVSTDIIRTPRIG